MLENIKDVLSVDDLYEILPLGRSVIYKLLKTGELHSIRVGKRIIVPKKSLEIFLEGGAK